MTIRLGQSHLDAIRAHGRETYPEECCGVLIGSEDRTEGDAPHRVLASVREICRMENMKPDERERRYIIDPLALMRMEDALEDGPHRIIGIYHSHPDHPARPSEFDRAHALPGWSYIVLRVAGGKDEALTSWRLRDDRSVFDEEPVEPQEDPSSTPSKVTP